VTLVTANRYVTRGLQYGLTEWRDNDFSWEHFGAVQPIRNADIWRRIDRALAFHMVQCRWMSQEESTTAEETSVASQCAVECADQNITLINRDNDRPSDASYTARPSSRVVTLATAPPIAHDEKNRPSTLATPPKVQRSVLPSSPAQHRYFVDTPISLEADLGAASLGTDPGKSQRKSSSSSCAVPAHKAFRIPSGVLVILSPLLFARRKMNALSQGVWEAILAIDRWLESFLRSLVLLDPKDRRSRQ
jgi:hypothetical protein